MSVADVGVKTKPTYVVKCLRCVLQLFSIDSCQTKTSKVAKIFYITRAFTTAVVFALIAIYSFQYKKKNVYHELNKSIIITDVTQMIYDQLQYVVDLFFVYKYGRKIAVEYYNQYVTCDRILDINDYSEIVRRQYKMLMILTVIWFVVSTTDFISWGVTYDWFLSFMYSPSYIFMLIKILTSLDLTAQVINVESRLKIIAEIVQDYYSYADDLPSHSKNIMKDSIGNKHWFYQGCVQDIKKKTLLLKSLKHHSCHEMKWLTRCYLLLTEQCVFISKLYGFRILLNSLSLLIDMVRFLNAAVRIAIGSLRTKHNSGLLPATSMILRLLECTSVFVSLVHHCEEAYRQRERIIFISTHLLVNKNPDASLRAAVTELRDLATGRPIVFSVAHFFTLNYSFLLSLASVVVTYSIILLQSM